MTPPDGFTVDRTRIELGAGEADFHTAKAALQRWWQFRLGWVILSCVAGRNALVEIQRPRCSEPSIQCHPFLKFAKVLAEASLESRMRIAYLLSCLALLMVTRAMAEDMPLTMFDFTQDDAATEWQTVNDGVMGGVSEGKFKITDKKTLEFFGTLSLENNGGFASVRTKAKKLGLEKGDTLVVRVNGDGREYSMNLYLSRPRMAFSYRATIQTKIGEWIEVALPLDKFEATSYGQVVKNAGTVKPEEVNGLGFLLGDKKAGPFKLEVEWVKVLRAAASK
jgi:monofunctional biosynthetic peptidoglycan transglycosylase